MTETLADLIASVTGNYRSPVTNSIARQRVSLPAVKAYEREQATLGPQGNAQDQQAGAYAPQPAATFDNGRMPGIDALEMTGLPSLRRGIQHETNSVMAGRDYERAADEAAAATPELAMGGLGALGMIGGGRAAPRELPARRLPMAEAPAEPITRLPVNPTRELGANALPIAEPQPFRNSMRGGSGDLMDAARSAASAPDAGGVGVERGADGPTAFSGINTQMPAPERMRWLRGIIDDARRNKAAWEEQIIASNDPATIEEAVKGSGYEFSRVAHANAELDRMRTALGQPTRLGMAVTNARREVMDHLIDGPEEPLPNNLPELPPQYRSAPRTPDGGVRSPESAPTQGDAASGAFRAYTLPLTEGYQAKIEAAGDPTSFHWSIVDANGDPPRDLSIATRSRLAQRAFRGLEDIVRKDMQTHAPSGYRIAGAVAEHDPIYNAIAHRLMRDGRYTPVTDARGPLFRRTQAPPNGGMLPPLGAAVIAGLSELPRRRTRQDNQRQTQPPSGGFFMRGASQ